MGLLENMKAKRQAKKEKEINAEITKIEKRKGKKLSQKGIDKVTKTIEAKRLRKTIRNAIIAALGSIGIVVGGHALLTDGNQPKEPEIKTETEMKNQKNTDISKRDAYLKELQDMSQYDNTDISQAQKIDTHIIDQILESYNNNLSEEEKIDKEDLGIILQESMGEGHVIKNISENGDVEYVEDYKALVETSDLQEGQEWVEAKDIDSIYVLIDKENENTVVGYGEIEGEYTEVDVQRISYDNIEYTKDDNTYVTIKKLAENQNNINKKQIFENFTNYYQERIEQQQVAEKSEGMER